MKQTILSGSLILLFIFSGLKKPEFEAVTYVATATPAPTPQPVAAAPTPSPIFTATPVATAVIDATPLPTIIAIATAVPTLAPTPLATPAATATPSGMYRNGTYAGNDASMLYGMIQVQATIQGGRISNVSFLKYPSDRRRSAIINTSALPILNQEAIQAQSEKVNIVSGATYTSEAFSQSLSSALAKAR
jgi:uncharacterized protein with FMN-binding domain